MSRLERTIVSNDQVWLLESKEWKNWVSHSQAGTSYRVATIVFPSPSSLLYPFCAFFFIPSAWMTQMPMQNNLANKIDSFVSLGILKFVPVYHYEPICKWQWQWSRTLPNLGKRLIVRRSGVRSPNHPKASQCLSREFSRCVEQVNVKGNNGTEEKLKHMAVLLYKERIERCKIKTK